MRKFYQPFTDTLNDQKCVDIYGLAPYEAFLKLQKGKNLNVIQMDTNPYSQD